MSPASRFLLLTPFLFLFFFRILLRTCQKTEAEVTIGWGGAGQSLYPRTIIDNIRNQCKIGQIEIPGIHESAMVCIVDDDTKQYSLDAAVEAVTTGALQNNAKWKFQPPREASARKCYGDVRPQQADTRRRHIMVEFPGDENPIDVGWEESLDAPRTLQQVREVLRLRGNLGEAPFDIVDPEDDGLLNGPSTVRPSLFTCHTFVKTAS
jgi:hypothetical protein